MGQTLLIAVGCAALYWGCVGLKRGVQKAEHAIVHVLKHGLHKHKDPPPIK